MKKAGADVCVFNCPACLQTLGRMVSENGIKPVYMSDLCRLAIGEKPVINDATMADAYAAGLHEIVKVIDNGSDAPGTILSDCSPEFQGCFKNADLIIAKGQGNYETLNTEGKNIFFLFRVKCAVVASHTGFEPGANVLAGALKKKMS
jgi:uncharacterized protein with ATP-grasp and redox domains